MPHDSSHGSSCGCSPEEKQQLEGTLDFLFSRIDRDRVIGFNSTPSHPGQHCIKPWDRREDETEYVESDADEQLILHIPFTGSVKLRSILIKSGPDRFTADKIKLFANQSLDFDQVTSTDVTQEFDLIVSPGVVEYALRPAKFPAVGSVTLFFPSNHGDAESTRIYFVGFKGEYKAFTRDPPANMVYELQANPADHNKIKGLNGAQSRIG